MAEYFKGKEAVDHEDVNSLLVAFIQRQRFSYNMKMVFEYILRCLCFKNISKKRFHPEHKKHYMFFKAKNKLEEELDVIHVIKAIKQFRLLNQSILS
jgi:hypothetical protein